ncbi:portal protein [Arthrobacter phage DanielleIgnace]|nr:portal protein [Arthrobacter phage DanielleIgnace]
MTQEMWLDDRGQVMSPGGDVKAAKAAAKERDRKGMVQIRRMYYEGEQYDRINETRAKAMKVASVFDLPEHEKLHAYSTQIQESVDFIAGQMSENFDLVIKDKTVQGIVEKALKRSPSLRGAYGQNNLSLTNTVRDALIAMDTPVLIRWDPVAETAWPEYWASEDVTFEYNERDLTRLEMVSTVQSVWATGFGGVQMPKNEITEYFLQFGECMKRTYFENERESAVTEPQGIPFIPWVSLRINATSVKEQRGRSIISTQACKSADRYNALEQVAFLIARYNSHGNLAVIGDGTTLKAQMDERINKDVADVMTFPGGTAIQVLTLPTDAQMIIHQRTVLLDSLFGSFGLARVDQETLTGLGQVTGYALEILNRRSEVTFTQIKNQYVGDFKTMLNMLLDMHVYKSTEQEFWAAQNPVGEDPMAVPVLFDEAMAGAMWGRLRDLDPLTVYPEEKRVFEIHLGSNTVVDKVQLKAEYDAGLISRAEYLRQCGYTEQEIRTINEELDKEKPPAPESGLGANGVAAGAAAVAAAQAAKAAKNPDPVGGKRQAGAPSDVPKAKAK